MKVLSLSTTDIGGGAAKAAFRIHQGLRALGVDSRMVVMDKQSGEFHVHELNRWKRLRGMTLGKLEALWVAGHKYCDRSALFSPAFLSANPDFSMEEWRPDLVHLHWINGGFLSTRGLSKIEVPVVWSLHDMWPFTGGCHYDQGCGQYVHRCGACPSLGSSREKDLSHRIFLSKARLFAGKRNIYPVASSNWLADCAAASRLMAGLPVSVIPTGVDITTFKPLDQATAREILGLPQDRTWALFGALHGTKDPRKGFQLLEQVMQRFDPSTLGWLILGESAPPSLPQDGFSRFFAGRLRDEVSMALWYAAADFTVLPSLQENLANMGLESLACGTPVVAFDLGGNPDMIDPLSNGYLAREMDLNDLAAGIQWGLHMAGNPGVRDRARLKAVRCFSHLRTARHYEELFRKILEHPSDQRVAPPRIRVSTAIEYNKLSLT